MAVKLFTLMKKNFTLLMRSKSSAFILVFGPLLLIVLMSAAFNTARSYSLVVGVYTESSSTLTESLLDGLKEKQMTVMTSESKEECLQGVKRGTFTACAVFPDDFSVSNGGTVEFFVDPSRQNLVYVVIESLTSEVIKRSKEISTQLTTGVLETISASGEELEDKQQLLSTLAEGGQDVRDVVEKLHASLLSLNLTTSSALFPFESLQAEIMSLKQGSNATTAVDKYLEDLENKVQEVMQEMNYVAGVRTVALKDLVAVKILVDEQGEYVEVLDSAFDDVLRDIRSLKMQSAGKIVSPLDAKIQSVTQEQTQLNYLFPTLLALIIMFVGLFLASWLEVRERMERVAFKHFILPTSPLLFVLANFLTAFLMILAQLLVLFVVALFFFREQLIGVFGDVILVVLLAVGVFVLGGMVIGRVFGSEESSLIAALSIGFLLLFFSSTILPVEVLPEIGQRIVDYNPFSAAQILLSRVLLFQEDVVSLLWHVLVLGGWVGGLSVLISALSVFRRNRA